MASLSVRSSMTAHFLMAAASQAGMAGEIESRAGDAATEDDKVRHRGFVVGAIMQATAALESEIWEVMVHGPGHHLGSDRIDVEARRLLFPLEDLIDREPVLERFGLVLHFLKKPALKKGAAPWQDAARR